MSIFKKIDYTLKAGIGGAGLGIAIAGGLSFIPILPITMPIAVTFSAVSSLLFSIYVFKNIEI